jgi:hypothetical protein
MDFSVGTDVSEKYTAYIFGPEYGHSMLLGNAGIWLQLHKSS